MADQLPLAIEEPRALGTEFLRLLREVVEHVGLKQVAYDLDMQPSLLAHMMAGRNGNRLPATAVPYLIEKAPNEEALDYLAALRYRETMPARPLEPAEELAALKDALAESLGPDLYAAVTAKARKKAAGR